MVYNEIISVLIKPPSIVSPGWKSEKMIDSSNFLAILEFVEIKLFLSYKF